MENLQPEPSEGKHQLGTSRPPGRLVLMSQLPRNCWESTGDSKAAKDEKKLFEIFYLPVHFYFDQKNPSL